MSASPHSKRIAELNDQLRARAGVPLFGTGVPGKILMTRGIADLPPLVQLEVWSGVKRFDRFTEDNDPYGEHDFGALDIAGAGKVFWKIDYFADAACRFGSEDPADPKKSYRVLAVMLASEY